MTKPTCEKAIYYEAIGIGDTERRATYLDSVCRDDPGLRARVQSLLDSNLPSARFMCVSPLDSLLAGNDSAVELNRTIERVGETIGRYKLLEKIGEGGFGYVFMAEQVRPVVRKVAVKVIKPGMDTEQVIARFEAERQALALMDHPNIGKILDAGATETGRPYFVMELVRGVPITDYCSERKLTMPERLALFKEVCGAIEHAHQKGIIHRDIKPSNILVYNNGERAVPKVIDFGIAKATQGRLTDKTLFTQFHQFIGTPAYMSPEQAQMSGVDVDTRSDIYSLGVLLYELLTGKTPLDLNNLNVQAYQEACRRIREDEAPVPSKRVSTLTKDERTSLANVQRSSPAEISTRLRGDLDWIVMKALEKDRSRRYKTTDALVTDIVSHLNNEPVSAGPPSAIYYARKFYQRHRAVVTSAFAFATLLVVGTIVSAVGWREAIIAKRALSGQVMAKEQALLESDRSRRESQQANEELRSRIYRTHLANADRALTSENFLRARVELESCSETLRSWEWRFLSDRLITNSPAVFPDAGDPLFTADGRYMIAGVRSTAAIGIWDIESAKRIRTFPYEGGLLALSPDESLLAVADRAGKKIVLDMASGNEVWSKSEYGTSFSAMEFSPDGRFLASFNSEDHDIVLRDALTGHEKSRIPIGRRIEHIRFTSNGRWMFVYENGAGAPASIVDAEKRELVKHFPKGQTVLSLHPDEEHIAVGSREGIVTIWRWDGSELAEGRKFEMSRLPIVATSFSSDGKRLVASDKSVNWNNYKGNSVKVWDVETGEELGTMDARDTAWNVRSVPNHPEQVAVSTRASGVVLWRYEVPKEGLTRKAVEASAVARFSPDGRTVAVSHQDYAPNEKASGGPVAILDAASGELIKAKSIEGQWQLASWIDQRRIACGLNADREIRIYDSFNGAEEAVLECPKPYLQHIVAAGDRLVAVFDDGTFGLWDLNTSNKACEPFGDPDRVYLYGVATSHDNNRVAIASYYEPDVEVWDVSTQDTIQSLPVQGLVHSIAFTRDGQSLYLGDSGGRLTKVEIESGTTTKRFVDHVSAVRAIALSPTENRLVSGDESGKVIVWDVEYEQPLVTLTSGPEPIQSLDWSSDGKRIVAGKKDGTIQIWSLPSS